MKATKTRGLATGAVALSLLLAGSAALAQGFGGGRQGAPGRGLRAALASLDLTEAQQAKVTALFEAERAKVQALREEGRAAREALKAAAAATSPDPAAVGNAFLRAKAHREAMKAEREASRAKLEAILTAEQRAKLEGWLAAQRQMRRGFGRGPRGFGRGGPTPPAG